MEEMDMRFIEKPVTNQQTEKGVRKVLKYDENGIFPYVEFIEYEDFYEVEILDRNMDKLDLAMIVLCFVYSKYFTERKKMNFFNKKGLHFQRCEDFSSICEKVFQIY